MTAAPVRRLAAILIADVAGYSRMMEGDEAGTHARLREARSEVTDPAIARHGGRIVRTAGDGMLVEFASVVDAIACGLAIQKGMERHNEAVPLTTRMQLRIGVHLGDIIDEGGDIYGSGVNIAARIGKLAEPGSVYLSEEAQRQVVGKVEASFADLGDQALKNIPQPIRVWSAKPPPRVAAASRPATPAATPSALTETSNSPQATNSASPSAPDGVGTVSISSHPDGAEIFVDDKFHGNTPATLKIPTGSHSILLKFPGRADWRRTLEVLKSSKVTLRATLEPSR